MTTRYCGVAVTFESDIRDDDAEGLLQAIRHLRGVVNVRPIEADPEAESILRMRVRNDLFITMRDALFEKP